MRILVLGGTQFIGRHIVEALLAAGHTVSILTRGVTVDHLPAAVERLRGDRDQGAAGLNALAGRTWDACVDVSGYTPRQVRASAELLEPYVLRYVFISAVSIYGDPDQRPVMETYHRLPPATDDVTEITGETYGPLKVACENIVLNIYDERCTLIRPQVVVGPYDVSGRYTYWLQRAQQGGEMLAPGDGTDHVQFIDVRDVARFVTKVIEQDLCGSFNLAGPRLTWQAFMKLMGAENIEWVSAEIIAAAGLTFVELPLFRAEGSPRSSLMDVSNARALRAGLKLTDPAVTARDMRDWSIGRDLPNALPPEREKILIQIAREQREQRRV
ncbi:MAG: NAD-dependent epimerase/dehydratase family protein [Betaproteobacteria bacterium]